MNPPPEVPEGGEEPLHADTTVFRFPCRALEEKFRTEGEEGPSARTKRVYVYTDSIILLFVFIFKPGREKS